MYQLTSGRRFQRFAALATFAALAFPTAGHAGSSLTLWAGQSITVSGSSNQFCGSAHSNGSVDVTGSSHLVSGPLEYVESLQTNQQSDLTPVQVAPAPMPGPPHDLAYYRTLARTSGTYFAGAADFSRDGSALAGVIFAEGDIALSGNDTTGTVTLVSATGTVKLAGSHATLTAAVDDLLILTGGDAFISGSQGGFLGAIFAPDGDFSHHGSEGSIVPGPIVAQTISFTGSRGHVGGQCCATDDDCQDTEACTADSCHGGTCTHAPLADCSACQPTPERCDDGIDNDCNGRTDCGDSACGAFPACKPAERCDNCVDDDGDGLVDSEDPDCCVQPMTLDLRTVILRPTPPPHRDGLKLRSMFARLSPANFDPLTQDTSIQISDDEGQIFCTAIAAMHFMPRGRHGMGFWGDGSFSNGLTDGRFTVARDGSIHFRTHGAGARVRTSTGRNVRVTVRVGAQCSQAATSLRANESVLLFP